MRKFLLLLALVLAPLVAGAQEAEIPPEQMEAMAAQASASLNATPLEKIEAFHSVCRFCPLIVMMAEEASFVFNIMWEKFRDAVLIFLALFGAFSFLVVFAGRFKNAPFELGEFSSYFKEMGGRMKAVLIAGVIAVIPPQTILSFTFEPVMLLSFGISEQVLKSAVPEQARTPIAELCNEDKGKVVDEINARRRVAKDDRAIPPIVRRQAERAGAEEQRAGRELGENSILSKRVVGGAVCLISNMMSANARQLTMGQVILMNSWNVFKFGWNVPMVFLMGLLVFGLFFLINLMIAFYVLDALIDVLELAFLWPFMLVGYAFDISKLKLDRITKVAVSFGGTMITLSVFSLLNAMLLGTFAFTIGKDKMMMDTREILDEAIRQGNSNIILDQLTNDVVGMSQFLFIAFAIFFTYANLRRFADSFGGQMSDERIRSAIQNTAVSAVKYVVGGVQQKGAKEGKPESVYAKKEKKEKTE